MEKVRPTKIDKKLKGEDMQTTKQEEDTQTAEQEDYIEIDAGKLSYTTFLLFYAYLKASKT